MDPVSFAVGIIGLAGLFSTCLEVVEKFDSFKEFGIESRSISAQFEAQRLRLQKWGQAVGLQGDTLMEKHSKLLDDPRTYSIVEKLLSAIQGVCTYADDLALGPVSPIEQRQSFRDQLWPRQGRPAAPHESKREKISWALRKKAKKMAQVGQFCSLVDNLHNLVPVSGGRVNDGSSQPVESGQGEDMYKPSGNAMDQGGWITEFGQILSGIENEIEDEIKRDLHPWLLGPNSQNELFEISAGKRIQGTCEWALSRDWFQDWSSSHFPERAKVLWINGPAGFGKSILCARIVEHMTSTSKAPVGHFFFSSDFESRRDPFIAIRSWISQTMSNAIAFGLIRQRASANQGQKSTRGDIVRLLRDIVESIPQCTFIIDGLDECGWAGDGLKNDEGDSVFNFLETLKNAVGGTQTRILIVSRDEPEIRNSLSNDDHDDVLIYRHKIRPDDVRSDTEIYSRSIVNKKLSNRTEATKEDIAMKLSDRCNGQFLWVKMQEDCLRSGKNRTISLLRWTAFALRPLTVNEITAALLISDDCEEVRVDELPDNVDDDYINTEILDLCGSLVEIRISQAETQAGLRTVHLAHFSVKQYLLSNIPSQGRIVQINSALKVSGEAMQSTLLANMCLCYVQCEDVWTECPDEEGGKNVLTAFRNYAAGSWQQHASLGNMKDERFIRLVNQLFSTENPSWGSWKNWFDLNDKDGGKGEASNTKSEETSESSDNEEASPPSTPDGDRLNSQNTSDCPLYYAAWMGLDETVDLLIRNYKGRINEQGNMGWTALAAACGRGNLEIAKRLLENGADLTIMNNEGKTPLALSCLNGHYEVVKLLLKNGADIETATRRLATPLYCAAFGGHLKIAELLLDHGANIDAQHINKWTPLHAAVDGGHNELVELLLSRGADIKIPINTGRVPFYTAARNGSLELVRLLYEYSPDINVSTQEDQWTPLNVAADLGHFEVVKFLIEKGADISIPNSARWTPVNSAAESGHLEVVKILVENGADIEVPNTTSMTPLYSAALRNHPQVVEYLLEQGARTDVQHEHGWTPLNCAAEDGFIEVAKMLIDHGADIEIANDTNMTPLYSASLNGHSEVLKMLLDKGAKCDVPNKNGWTPINVACSNGHTEVVRMLLEHNPDLEYPDNTGWTPINAAADHGHLEIEKMLIQTTANIEATNKSKMTSLYSASLGGYSEIVKLLLERGPNINAQHKSGWTPINAASSNGHLDVVKQLLAKGADITITDTNGWTPLNSAAESGHFEIVNLLLAHGADIEAKNTTGMTPLYSAAWAGHTEVVEALIAKGADYTMPNKNGWTPVNVASSNGHTEVIRLLLAQDPLPSLTESDANGWTPLNAASDHEHVEVVKMLLEKGAESTLETENRNKQTPLYCATLRGSTEILKLLIDSGANINAQKKYGWTSVNTACSKGYIEAVKLLLANGADISMPNFVNATPLYSASVHGYTEIVRLLLENGADVNIARNDKWTPLMAAATRSPDIVKLLLQRGADAEVANDKGRTVLHTAAITGNIETCNMLFEYANPELEAQDQCGRTPFSLAALKGHVAVMKLLQSKNASVDSRDKYGATPLVLAVRSGHSEAVEYLLSLNTSEIPTHSELGGDLFWWALGSGNDKVMDLVGRSIGTANVKTSEVDSETKCSLAKYDPADRWCDVCTRSIAKGDIYQNCKDCYDFDVCLQCVGFGAQCSDSSHTWENKEPDPEPEKPEEDESTKVVEAVSPV
ncbi:uncharacterized protein N7484_004741 [Penicillium longicatenatum]|uniref:uncharacterized protein n=1 Tax=Penicillium longicatenatum TaxID=1561947 RepID=UPI0025486E7B|nr:uncharacterized protein N7484_004741 [Penicillium longicatenatum]KAJ5651018.1 hypothetical protein N7484_004741 [Penicillium longicatenatum]